MNCSNCNLFIDINNDNSNHSNCEYINGINEYSNCLKIILCENCSDNELIFNKYLISNSYYNECFLCNLIREKDNEIEQLKKEKEESIKNYILKKNRKKRNKKKNIKRSLLVVSETGGD